MRRLIFAVLSILAISFFSFGYHFLTPTTLANISGGCDDENSPFMHSHFRDNRKITFCTDGDAYKGQIKSAEFQGKGRILFSYAGYPNNENVHVRLMSADSIVQEIILPPTGERWANHQIAIPAQFLNSQLHLQAIDQSTKPQGWIGLTHIEYHKVNIDILHLLLGASILFFAIVLLSVGLYFLLPKFGSVNAIVLIIILFGLTGYLVFFLYVIDSRLGKTSSIALLLGASISTAWIIIQGNHERFIHAFRFLMPIGVISFIIIFIGYYPALSLGSQTSWQTGATRWLDLPIDNWLPKIFGDQIFSNSLQRPMVGDWYSSDRPPLQTGIYLIFNPLLPGNDILYQVVSTMLQCMILLPIWMILSRLDCGHARRWMILSFSFSSLFLVNSLFVWPKLISAAYVCICFYFLYLSDDGRNLRNLIIGSAAALAMLSHGGAFFALIGIFLFWIIINVRNVSLSLAKDFITWAVIFIFIMLPWIIYGKYVDPQYSRLIKWHMAGLIPPSEISLTSALHASYSEISTYRWLAGRLSNIVINLKGFIFFESSLWSGNFSDFIGDARSKSFFQLFYSFWLFSPFIVLPAWILFGDEGFGTILFRIFGCTTLGFIAWCLLMFTPESALIHQGSYYIWTAFFLLSQVLLWRTSKALFYIFATGNFLVSLALYIFSPGVLASDLIYIIFILISIVLFWRSLNFWSYYNMRLNATQSIIKKDDQ